MVKVVSLNLLKGVLPREIRWIAQQNIQSFLLLIPALGEA
jgi:hypothetical protein